MITGFILAGSVVTLVLFPEKPSSIIADYDPIHFALSMKGRVRNQEAPIPPQCYTKTAGSANPCWTCHTASRYPNGMNDWDLQREYAFSRVGTTNHWTNLFEDRTETIKKISNDEILAYIRTDNYTPFRAAMLRRAKELTQTGYTGYIPDIDFRKGFDPEGFAQDGSRWRAFRYKPFLGTFWPTNGSTDDVFIRLPLIFHTDAKGAASRAIAKINFAILEAAMTAPIDAAFVDLKRKVEPINETLAGIDLDRNGTIGGIITIINGLPKHYVGAATHQSVTRGLYPKGVEFLHSVRYIDPDKGNPIAQRMKELRYIAKRWALDREALNRQYDDEYDEKLDGRLPYYPGSVETGFTNRFGWQVQGFIENAQGQLRLQTEEEHRFCMGCHSTIGVTADQTFAFPRKVPGASGWTYQDIRGIPDVPQYGHEHPEFLTYLERVGGGDEFRANQEILDRFFPGGQLNIKEVKRAAPGGDKDIAYLILPSRVRALVLNKAYWAIVREQDYIFGRAATIKPTRNVHRSISNGSTDLATTKKIYKDGRLRLNWSL
ncbi:MAG: hypothetical protein KTR25_17690 [Myxococcales bacterium]|nr:hypothetical protein [Myxococcales bacterium]